MHWADVIQHILIADHQTCDYDQEVEAKEHLEYAIKAEIFLDPEEGEIT